MTAPDRSTREQVDADLARADQVLGWPARLAAEVRALRAELDRVHSCLRHESDAHVTERDRLRAALAARTPQPAEPGPNRTHLEMAGTAGVFTVWRIRAPGGTPHVAHRIDVDPRCLTLSWANGARPRATVEHVPDCSCGDLTGRLTKALATPLPAVPDGEDGTSRAVSRLMFDARPVDQAAEQVAVRTVDLARVLNAFIRCRAAGITGEDVPARLDAARDRLLRHYLAKVASRIGLPDQARRVTPMADFDEIETIGEAVLAELERLHSGPPQDAADVPARLVAVAEAMQAAGMSGYWCATVRDLARRLRDVEPPEVCGVVAAALARPTGGEG